MDVSVSASQVEWEQTKKKKAPHAIQKKTFLVLKWNEMQRADLACPQLKIFIMNSQKTQSVVPFQQSFNHFVSEASKMADFGEVEIWKSFSLQRILIDIVLEI